MQLKSHWKQLLLSGLVLSIILPAAAQVITVDITDAEDPSISYDEDPHLYAPDFPEYPLVIYSDASATSTLDSTTEDVEGVEVKTEDPDTHSLGDPRVYYTPPAEPAGPHKQLSAPLYFDLGPGPVETGYTQVDRYTQYGPETGYGWGDISKVNERDRGGDDALARDFCLPAGTPFFVDLPNGTYEISLVVGDAIGRSRMEVRAEGMLELYNIGAPAGQYAKDSFPITVHDGRLMLEFFGGVCHVNAITITKINEKKRKTTIFVASDSTASYYGPGLWPMMGWGAHIADYFDEDIVVDNMAIPGRSSKSFYEEGSLAALENRIRPGDYLFVMFAINDSADDNSKRKTYSNTTFKAYLRLYVATARDNGATPVFVTSQTKRTFDLWGRFTNSVQGYPQAMRELGAELDVPVIDLNKKSIDFFTEIGPEATKDTFMFLEPGEYPAWPNGASDYIHLQDNGAKQLAGLIAECVRELDIQPLAKHLLEAPRPRIDYSTRTGYGY